MQNPLSHEFFSTVIALLTSAHIRDWKTFSDIIEEKSILELRALAAHAAGMLYAATLSEAEARNQEYLEFLSQLSLRGQNRFWDMDS